MRSTSFAFSARLLPASQCRRRLGTSTPIGRPGTKTWTSPCISIWQSPSGTYTKKSISMWPTTKSTSSMMAMWQRISASNASLASTTCPCPKKNKIYCPKLISEIFPELSSKIPKLVPKIIPKSLPKSNFPKLRLKIIANKCSARKFVNIGNLFLFFKEMFLKLNWKVVQSKNPTSFFRHARTRHSSHASRRRVLKMSFRRAWRRAKPVKLGQGGPPNEQLWTLTGIEF